MSKRLLVLLLALCLVSTQSGCTSGDSKDETEVAEANDETFAEEGEGDFADEEGGEQASSEGESTGDQAATSDEAPPEDSADDLNLGDEEPPKEQAAAEPEKLEDELSLEEPKETAEGEPAAAEGEPAAAEGEQAVAEEPPPPTDEPVFDEPAKEEPAPQVAETEPPPAVEEPESAAPTETAESEPPPAPVYAPYLKMKEAAFTAADGTNLNRIYVARPKDTLKSVATKLYGDASRSKDIKKWNPMLNRGVRTGDKIYYASASNPTDGRMITYYEEQNVPPQMYVSKPGENIRAVSKELLGFNDAWKEVWGTNLAVESKGDIPEGTELRYWPEGSAPPAAPPLAQNEMAPPAEQGLPEMAPPPPDMNIPPPADGSLPPPADQQAGMEPPPADPMAPPPPMPEDPTATGTTDTSMPPPPPTDLPQAPPPMDKPVAKKPAMPIDEMADGGMDADTTMVIGLGGILLIAAAILFVVIRKNRAKRMDLGQTQV